MATETVQMKVSGLMCSFCTMSVEKALKRYPGVKSVMVNLVHGLVLVEADTNRTSKETLAEAVEKLGYDVSSTEAKQYATDEALFSLIKKRSTIGMVVAIIDLLVDPLNILNIQQDIRAYFSLIASAFILFWVGFPILRKTILAIRQRVINANVLLSTGAWGSFIIGSLSFVNPAWPNFLPVAGWLMALHLFFGYFKLDTRKKASDAVRKLLSLQPLKARVVRGDQTIEVLTNEVNLGEVLITKPGERIALDGEVIEGIASVDESSFTGESVPSTKEVGSKVIGGTLNLDGALRIKVTKTGEDTFLNQIVKLMSQITNRKPPLELLADRLMNYYGPVVFIVAAIAFIGWAVFTGDFTQATIVLLTTIIMGYPCALGITTPTLAAIAGGKGISIGLLVKASEVFHELSVTDTIVFDKTGTLTYGRPTVTEVVSFGMDKNQFLSLASSLEASSEHPLGQAIVFYAQKEGASKIHVQGFRALPGKGVSASINEEEILGGKPSFIEARSGKLSGEISSHIERLSNEGKTVVVFTKNNSPIGLVGLEDTIRKDASHAIKKINHYGLKTVMLTGDSKRVAEAVGKKLGINEIRSELLPTDKVSEIEKLQNDGRKVAMVGDGINDAPALAQANVGLAIGAGTDVAIESAGVILMGDKLEDVLGAIKLGKASYRTMTINVIIAVLFNIVGMILAGLGFITPLFAIAIMIFSIFAIQLNTLRIRAIKLRTEEIIPEASSIAVIEFKVPQMVCEGCAENISSILGKMDGIKNVKPKVNQKQVKVQYDPAKVQAQEVKDALGKIGYTAIEV